MTYLIVGVKKNMSKSLIKKVKTAMLSSIIVASLIGLNAFAASGDVNGYMNGTEGVGITVNTSGQSAYTEAYVVHGSGINTATVVGYNNDVVASGDGVTARGQVSAPYAWAKGNVYNGGSPYSGIGWSGNKQIKW